MNLMSCFDRMVHPISSLATQRLGCHPNMAACMIKTLCKMTHFIKIAYRDSIWSYAGESNRLLQGSVQENGATSPIFIAISYVILLYEQSQVVGVYFISAISFLVFSIIAILYVDDSDILITAIQKDESVFSIFNRTKKTADTYQ